MANYSIKADLLKLTGAFVTNIKGKTATKATHTLPRLRKTCLSEPDRRQKQTG